MNVVASKVLSRRIDFPIYPHPPYLSRTASLTHFNSSVLQSNLRLDLVRAVHQVGYSSTHGPTLSKRAGNDTAVYSPVVSLN
jgi:hypothetical protein